MGVPALRRPSRLGLATAMAAVSIAVAGCGGVVTGGRDARDLEVEAGEEFQIVLEANPSVGDEWRVVEGPDPAVAELRSEEWDADSDATGAGGRVSFRFDAVARGATTIVLFNCFRCVGADEPAPDDLPLAETLRFRVTVT